MRRGNACLCVLPGARCSRKTCKTNEFRSLGSKQGDAQLANMFGMVRRALGALFTLVALASLLACAAALILWKRSYRQAGSSPVGGYVGRLVHGVRYTVRSEAGRIKLC